jgi:hypothetical protein
MRDRLCGSTCQTVSQVTLGPAKDSGVSTSAKVNLASTVELRSAESLMQVDQPTSAPSANADNGSRLRADLDYNSRR